MRQVNFLLETLICGRKKFLFDLTFTKVVAANTMKFGFYNEGREYLCKACKVSLADWSCRR